MVDRINKCCDSSYRGKPCPDEAQNYVITTPVDSWEVDLCARHAAPLMDIMGLGRKVKPASAGKGGRRTRARSRLG